ALEREPDDRMLIEAAQRERSHFAELYEQNFHRVYTFIARRAAGREEAQDLTAEVFHQALASLETFKWQGTPFIAWLYGIATNVEGKYAPASNSRRILFLSGNAAAAQGWCSYGIGSAVEAWSRADRSSKSGV